MEIEYIMKSIIAWRSWYQRKTNQWGKMFENEGGKENWILESQELRQLQSFVI